MHEYVDTTELTVELGGTLPYFHQHWIQQRMVFDKDFTRKKNKILFICIYRYRFILQLITLNETNNVFLIIFKALESFSNETNAVSSMLNEFTESLTNDIVDLPNTKEQSADLLCRHAVEYGRLKKNIAEAVKKGESLLSDFKQDTDTYHGTIPSTVTNVAALER